MEKEYLTKEKFEELSNKLDDLKSNKRREIAENLEYAKSLGDLSENAEYHDARAAQAELEDEIIQLEEILKRAEIIGHKHGSTVSVGSTITIKKEGGEEKTFDVVGSAEADLSQNKISVNSPIGKGAFGKKKGETFEIETPKGKVEYKITAIK